MPNDFEGKIVKEEDVAKDLGFTGVHDLRRWQTDLGRKLAECEVSLRTARNDASRFRWHGRRMMSVLERLKTYLALPAPNPEEAALLILAIGVVTGKDVDWGHLLDHWFEEPVPTGCNMFDAALYTTLIEKIPVERRTESVIRSLVGEAGGHAGKRFEGTFVFDGLAVHRSYLEVFDDRFDHYCGQCVEMIGLSAEVDCPLCGRSLLDASHRLQPGDNGVHLICAAEERVRADLAPVVGAKESKPAIDGM